MPSKAVVPVVLLFVSIVETGCNRGPRESTSGVSEQASMEPRHWQYSFITQTCRLDDRVNEAPNPFTGAIIKTPIDEGLSREERQEIRKVFDRYGVKGPEAEFEGYALYLPRNGSVRFRHSELEQKEPITGFSAEIVIEELNDEALRFVLEVARAGNLAFMSTTGEHVRLAKASSDPRVKQRWPDASVIETTDALRSWLESQIGGRQVQVSKKR